MTPKAQFWWLQTVLPGAGLLALVLGVDRDLPLVADAGVLLLAAAGVAGGGATAALRRVVVVSPATYRLVLLTFTGPAAVFAGAAFVVLGLAAGAAGLLHLSGTSAAGLKSLLASRPGLALAPAGLALLSHGLAFLVGFPEGRDAARGAAWNALLSIPARLGGAVLVLLGAAALGIGAWELAAPDAFDGLVASLAR